MRLDNISHLGSIKFRVCMEHLWHDFISTQSFLFFFLFLVLHIYIFFTLFLNATNHHHHVCTCLTHYFIVEGSSSMGHERVACNLDKFISLLEKKNIYSRETKSVKAISHIPVLSLVIKVQSSVLCTASKRFENITYLSSLFECALHTCLNKHVM